MNGFVHFSFYIAIKSVFRAISNGETIDSHVRLSCYVESGLAGKKTHTQAQVSIPALLGLKIYCFSMNGWTSPAEPQPVAYLKRLQAAAFSFVLF